MNNDRIRTIALMKGFKLKEQPDGSLDLNPYVYDFAHALLERQETKPQKGLAMQILDVLFLLSLVSLAGMTFGIGIMLGIGDITLIVN